MDTGPIITIFRSRLRDGNTAIYHEVAVRMEELARAIPGFVSFKTFAASDGERVSLVEFADEESHNAWRSHSEHRHAQEQGRDLFYAEYSIQVCRIERAYSFAHEPDGP